MQCCSLGSKSHHAFLNPELPCSQFRYTPAIEATNEKLKAYARLHTRVDFVDCSAPFLEDDDKVIHIQVKF